MNVLSSSSAQNYELGSDNNYKSVSRMVFHFTKMQLWNVINLSRFLSLSLSTSLYLTPSCSVSSVKIGMGCLLLLPSTLLSSPSPLPSSRQISHLHHSFTFIGPI